MLRGLTKLVNFSLPLVGSPKPSNESCCSNRNDLRTRQETQQEYGGNQQQGQDSLANYEIILSSRSCRKVRPGQQLPARSS